MMEIIIDNKKENLYKAAAKIIENSIKKILNENSKVVIAVPGGRSAPPIFGEMKKLDIEWEKVHIYLVDDRLVDVADEQSNSKLVKENLGNIKGINLHLFNYDKSKKDLGVDDYKEEVKKEGRFDIVLLSSGEDGHIAALFPDHETIKNDNEYLVITHSSPKLPKDRMSASRKLLLKSKIALIIFIGEGKADAYQKFNEGAVSVESCPAKIVRSIPKSYVLTGIKG